MPDTANRSYPSLAAVNIRSVEASRPFAWLQRGWSDIRRAPLESLGYGLVFGAAGAAILSIGWGAAHLLPVFATGFVLVAPFLATVLYALSQQMERGDEVSTVEAFFAWRANTGQIALFALLLVLAFIVWERVAAIVFALSFGGAVPDLRSLFSPAVFSPEYMELLLAYFGVGGLIAIVVFVCSVVSLPFMLDREVDIITAVVTSMRCCARNPGAMIVWAAIIAALSVLGIATLMIGMVVIFPLLGHATWHAYRDLVE
ncbi:MAG TPA: DUF2189 domain-containing protein [Burkholderiaceae bacterium]|nr:DUF2189 domain-containing protein [Burkholderiaceae bacterium]